MRAETSDINILNCRSETVIYTWSLQLFGGLAGRVECDNDTIASLP